MTTCGDFVSVFCSGRISRSNGPSAADLSIFRLVYQASAPFQEALKLMRWLSNIWMPTHDCRLKLEWQSKTSKCILFDVVSTTVSGFWIGNCFTLYIVYNVAGELKRNITKLLLLIYRMIAERSWRRYEKPLWPYLNKYQVGSVFLNPNRISFKESFSWRMLTEEGRGCRSPLIASPCLSRKAS